MEPELTMPTVRRLAELIAAVSPGARVTGYCDHYRLPRPPVVVTLPYARIGRLLGATYPISDVVSVLTRLQFQVDE